MDFALSCMDVFATNAQISSFLTLMPNFVELNRAIFKRFLSAHWPTVGVWGETHFYVPCRLTRACDQKSIFGQSE